MLDEEKDILDEAKKIYQETSETSILMYAGLIAGLVLGMSFIISTFEGVGWGVVGFFVLLWGVRLLITPVVRLRRMKYANGYTFGQAFSKLFRVIMYAALIGTFVKYLYLQFMNSDYLSAQFVAILEIFEKAGMELTTEEMTAVEQFIVPIRFVMYNMALDIVAGMPFAACVALFIRGKKRE